MKGKLFQKFSVCGRSFLAGALTAGAGVALLLVPVVGWLLGPAMIAVGLYLMVESLFVCPFV